MKSKKPKKTDEVEAVAFSEAEVDELLATVEESIAELKAVEIEPEVVEEVKVEIEATTNITFKAYNIRKNNVTRQFLLDTITYSVGSTEIKVETRSLGLSTAMAMYEIKKIFTNKLILKKAGV